MPILVGIQWGVGITGQVARLMALRIAPAYPINEGFTARTWPRCIPSQVSHHGSFKVVED